MHKSWSDTQAATTAVDATYVNNAVTAAAASHSLQTPAYVDGRDALRASIAAVNAADTAYVPATHLGVPGGVAALDGTGALIAAQAPAGTVTDRVARWYDAATNGTILITGLHQVTTQTAREYKLASVPIPDPGHPWRPLVLGSVAGYSNVGGAPARTAGTGGLGLLTVMPPAGVSNTIYGVGVCTGVYQKTDFYQVVPYGGSNMTPLTVPPIVGALELDLWGCCYTSTQYVFAPPVVFGILVLPAL